MLLVSCWRLWEVPPADAGGRPLLKLLRMEGRDRKGDTRRRQLNAELLTVTLRVVETSSWNADQDKKLLG